MYTRILTCTQYDFGATGDNADKTCQPQNSTTIYFLSLVMTYSVCIEEIHRVRFVVSGHLSSDNISNHQYDGVVPVGFSIGINWRRVSSCGFLKTERRLCYTRCRQIRVVFHLKGERAFHRTLSKILIRKFILYYLIIERKKSPHIFTV